MSLLIRKYLKRVHLRITMGGGPVFAFSTFLGLSSYWEDASYTVAAIAKLGFSLQSRKNSEESTTWMVAKCAQSRTC